MMAKGHKTEKQTHFLLGPLSFKLRVFLAKQFSWDFMYSFLGLIAPRNHPFQHRAIPASGVVSGLKSGGGFGQARE